MSVYSRKSSRSYKSSRTQQTNKSRRTQNSIRPKLLHEIKSKHGFVNSQAWHIKAALLDRIQKPNPFNRLISSHDKLSAQQQSSVCSTLSTCIEIIMHKKSNHDREDEDNDTEATDMMDTEIDESIHVSATELFAVFMTLLEGKNNDQHEMSIIILLSHLIASIPINVLLNKFDDLSQKLSHYFQRNVASTICVEFCVECMSAMLASRIANTKNEIFLTNIWCQKMLQGLFVTSCDDLDKIRKLSLKHIKKIFKLYPKDELPQKVKDLMRCFIERQIEGLLTESSDENKDKAHELNVIAFISELLMETLEYHTLKQSSYILSLLFNVISYKTQSYGDNRVQFKQLTLTQMFLKLLHKFIKSLPIKFNLKATASTTQNTSALNNTNIDELAKQLSDKMDLKTLVKNMTISDDIIENEDDEHKQQRYVRFVLQLFDVIQQLKPQTSDTVAIPIYFDCLVGIIDALYVFDAQQALQRCVSVITIIFDGFESNKKKIVQKSSTSIIQILELIVNKELIQQTKDAVHKHMRTENGNDDDPMALSASPGLEVPIRTPRNKLPVLQRITILIESLFDFKYKSSWMYVYSLSSAMFRIFGDLGFFLLQNILNELSEIRLMDEPLYLTSLEDAIASAIKWCGPDHVLSVIPLNLPTSDILELIPMDKAILKANLWLLPLLKHNVNRTKLSFFGLKLVPIADRMMKQAKASADKNMIVHKKQFDAISHQIWNIFPSFCIYPADVNEIFPQIAESIAFYLMNFKDIRRYIICGLIHLIRKPSEFIRRENEKGIFGNEMIEKAKQQMQTVAKYTENYLPILCNILVQTDHDKRCNVLRAICLFSEIADKEYIAAHFQRTMVKCLEDDTKLLQLRKEIMEKYDDENEDQEDVKIDPVQMEEIKNKYEKLLNQETAYLLILNEMIEFVDISPLEKFWQFLKQQFVKTDQSPLIQKLLYKNLWSILNYKESTLLSDHKQLINFTKFIIEIHKNGGHNRLCIGARSQRLHCIHTLLDCLAEYELTKEAKTDVNAFIDEDEDDMKEIHPTNAVDIETMKQNPFSFINVYPTFIGELIESVSLSNLKIRKSALNIIELIALRLDDISSDLFDKFILKLLGGLLSKTSTFQSATILCLTYLIVQFELRIPAHVLSELLKTISLRIEDPANNVIKSSLDFIQIVIQEMPDAILEENLMDLLTTLLKWLNDDSKSKKFKFKINKNLDLLLKRFGYAKIIKMVPHRFERLMKYLRKRADYIANKRERKKKKERENRLNAKLFNKQLDELPPDHPLNTNETQAVSVMMSDDDHSDDDGKLTVFEQLKTERMSSKSRRSRGRSMGDTESVRMRIDGDNDITDLSSKTAIKKQLISEYEANKLLTKEKRMKELGLQQKEEESGVKQNGRKRDHIKELPDGRLLITLSDEEEEDKKDNKYKKGKKWKHLSDEENDESGSDLSDDDDRADGRDVDDVLTQYSKFNKMTQLKKALADVSQRGSNKRLAANQKDVMSKRRRILDSVKNDEWIPGQLQPYKYHMISPALLSKKKRHFRQSAFQRVMGQKRNVVVRTDSFDTNYLKISRTRKVGHGRYTLKRSKIKAKQKHLLHDIQTKTRQNRMRNRNKNRNRSKSRGAKGNRNKKKRGTKRRLAEM